MSAEQKKLINEAKKLCDSIEENNSLFSAFDEEYAKRKNVLLERRLESVITELHETFNYHS